MAVVQQTILGVLEGLVEGALLLVREGQKVLGLLGKEMTEELELLRQIMAAGEAVVLGFLP